VRWLGHGAASIPAGIARLEARFPGALRRATDRLRSLREPEELSGWARFGDVGGRQGGLDLTKTWGIASALCQTQTPNALDLKDIKELIALMRKNDLSAFKLEQEGFKISLKRGMEPVITTAPVAYAAPAAAPAAQPVPASKENLREVNSPMVGTFYSAPSPESAAYVSVGQEVKEDTVVCIIEAMKVMNEIRAECRGVIAEVVAENGKPVQFGQPLFRIR
jgi:acetyl-CoA carboxylase biotin carboxyl carrier protein